MISGYKVLYRGGEGEITEKKSRFIATTRPVETEAEALAFIEEMKKKYWDARHNCSAYIIGKGGETKRCNDDGEPGRTAGRPILEVLAGQELCNACVVVTRYFGGVLLGTGGLVRAYTGAALEGLKNSVVIEKLPGRRLQIITDYNGIGKIQYLAGTMDVRILDTEYTGQVSVTLMAPEEKLPQLLARVMEKTGGRAQVREQKKMYYALLGQEVLLFET